MDIKLCRLCCTNEASLYIFINENDSLNLSAKIMYCCANIKIEDGDGLPSYICDGCEREIEKCFKFILRCETSDKQLRSLGSQITSDENTTVDIKTDIKLLIESDDDRCDGDDIPLQQLQHDAIKFQRTEVKILRQKKIKLNIRGKKNVTGVQCSVCLRLLNSHSALVTHMRSHTNEHPFLCSMCDKKYKDRGSLKRHIERNHSGERMRNFICESCGRGFFSKSDLNIHMRTHTGETPYACNECPHRFTQLSALLRHKKRHSGVKDYMCSICPKSFCTKVELKMHFKVHSTERNYSCPICSTGFKHHCNLSKHIKMHNTSHSFICNYCERSFKFKGSLKMHIQRIHSEKSGFCKTCSQNVSNLEVHMWKHTGQRPLKCQLCESSFSDQRGLARHVTFKHTKTDKYKCDFDGCSMVFPSRPMLDYHVAKIHGTCIPFPCDICTRAFYRKNDLVRHKNCSH